MNLCLILNTYQFRVAYYKKHIFTSYCLRALNSPDMKNILSYSSGHPVDTYFVKCWFKSVSDKGCNSAMHIDNAM